MRKLVIACIIAVITAAIPAYAGEDDLLARIEALEERVAHLEELLAGNEQPAEAAAQESVQGEEFTLGAGTWIIGEDLPAGKYNMTCINGTGRVMIYNSYEDRKAEEYSYFEDYTVASQGYLDQTGAYLGDALTSMYVTEANNIRLEDGNCIYCDSVTVVMTIVR